MDNGTMIGYPQGPTKIVIHAEDGRELIAIHSDGTVTGAIEDASEAAAAFIAALRIQLTPAQEAHCG